MNKSLDAIAEDTDKAGVMVKDAERNATEIENTIQATLKNIAVSIEGKLKPAQAGNFNY